MVSSLTAQQNSGGANSLRMKKLFWKRIYGEMDSSSTVIFNRQSLGIYTICKTDHVEYVLDSLHKKQVNPRGIRIKPGRKEFVRDAILRAEQYPFIRDSLAKHNLNPILKWLPVLESGYLDTMVSPQNARGIWQFIPSTGKRFGLSADELHDPVKSTGAFVRYFTALFDQFEDLGLALTAYHHGEGGIKRKLQKSAGRSLEAIFPTLGFQSRNYYAKFLAIAEIAEEIQENSDR